MDEMQQQIWETVQAAKRVLESDTPDPESEVIVALWNRNLQLNTQLTAKNTEVKSVESSLRDYHHANDLLASKLAVYQGTLNVCTEVTNVKQLH